MSDPGGVLSRAGHTEASCDLAALAGCEPAGVICEIMNDDGSMARRPDLEKFAEEHDLKIGTIADLIHYRTMNERTVECVEQNELDTEYGLFKLHTYRDNIQGATHLAMVMGDIQPEEPVFVRVHITDTLRDLLGARRKDSRSWPLHHALEKVAEEGKGVVVLLNSAEDSYNLEDRIQEFFDKGQGSSGKGSSACILPSVPVPRFSGILESVKCACSVRRLNSPPSPVSTWKWWNTYLTPPPNDKPGYRQ